MSQQYVSIENDIPVSVTCKGIYYEETKSLSLAQLSMFIDRDLFRLRRSFPESSFYLSVVLIRDQKQLRVEATAINISESQKLKKRIEQILWSYNQQVLIAKCGRLIPTRTRFTYRVEIKIPDKGFDATAQSYQVLQAL
ncbi:MAG: hypothetical protein HRU09_13930 [Oligoflexales bacterium]|nr:hypothetical protein [Oligoflexales bacterium]